jgi:hypothetical protein
MNSVIGSLPQHLYIWVDTTFTHKKSIGFIKAVWFGLVSIPGRMWGCNIMFENGAVYRNVPPHAISFSEFPIENKWENEQAQMWDCYGEDFSVLKYKYLSDLECGVIVNKEVKYIGKYLFTVIPYGDGFSNSPDQAKEFTFIELENNRLTIQPTNYILFREISFTDNIDKFTVPLDLKKQTEIYYCEQWK